MTGQSTQRDGRRRPVFNTLALSADFDGEVYESMADRPGHVLGRSELTTRSRNVLPRAEPVAVVRLDEYRWLNLYGHDQTRPFTPTPRISLKVCAGPQQRRLHLP